MSILTDYTPDEQQLFLRSLGAAATAVSASSPGRKVETAKEGFAAASYILESRAETLDNPLIGSIQFALEARAKAGESFASFEKMAAAPGALEEALATLRQVSALLQAKVPSAEAAGFAAWLMKIAVATSQAGKEGDNFWGRGGVLVNTAEEAMLQEIAAILGVQA